MIHSTLDESARYESLHPRFKEVFDYIKSHDLRAMEPQRLELRGEELFINRIDAPSNPQDEQPIEAHESYIDIQVLLEGRERIGWLPRAKCLSPRAPYDESRTSSSTMISRRATSTCSQETSSSSSPRMVMLPSSGTEVPSVSSLSRSADSKISTHPCGGTLRT